MSITPYLSIFLAIFIAELGDKTQLAAVMFASNAETNPWLVFAATAAALVVSAGIAVLLGSLAAKYITMLPMKLIAGIVFMLLGGLMILEHLRA